MNNQCARHPCGQFSGGCSFTNCAMFARHGLATVPGWSPHQPMGCICPPTSEQTCQNSLCPRKGHLRAAGSI